MSTPTMHPHHTAASEAAKPTWQTVSEHVNKCQHCLFAIASQRQSLAKSGCAVCRELLSHFKASHSPIHQLHLSEDMIEEHFFNRLSSFELRLFNIHVSCCNSCAATLHNERLFLYALQAALVTSTEAPPNRNRDGATFQMSAA